MPVDGVGAAKDPSKAHARGFAAGAENSYIARRRLGTPDRKASIAEIASRRFSSCSEDYAEVGSVIIMIPVTMMTATAPVIVARIVPVIAGRHGDPNVHWDDSPNDHDGGLSDGPNHHDRPNRHCHSRFTR